MLETTTYVRKPIHVDVVQVTAENIYEVAKWANGDVRSDSDNAKYVKVRVHRPITDRQTKAFIGDYVLYGTTGFKVYTPKAFSQNFDLPSAEETVSNAIERPKPKKPVNSPTKISVVADTPTVTEEISQTA